MGVYVKVAKKNVRKNKLVSSAIPFDKRVLIDSVERPVEGRSAEWTAFCHGSDGNSHSRLKNVTVW